MGGGSKARGTRDPTKAAVRLMSKKRKAAKESSIPPETAESSESADTVASQTAETTEPPTPPVTEHREEKGRVAMYELMHQGHIMETEDTAVCWLCRKWFSPPSALETHTCDARGKKVHVDLATCGVLYAAHCVRTGEHHVVQRGTAAEELSSDAMVEKVLAAISPEAKRDHIPMEFEPGWARRPLRGSGKGASYIKEYRREIYDMFRAGEEDKRQRKAPTQMLEVLQKSHPGIIALPGFSEISSFVGSLIARAKVGKTDYPEPRAGPIPTAIQQTIEALDVLWSNEEQPGALPRGHRIGTKKFTVQNLYDSLKAHYTTGDPGALDDDFPEAGRFKSLISTQRRARKALANRGSGQPPVNLLRK